MSRTSNLRRPRAALLMAAALAASVVIAAVVLASPAWADTYTVTNNADSGAGSLRQAIIDADTTTGVEDTINFNLGSSAATITLTSPLPPITDAAGLTIDGGSANIEINGDNKYRVFEVGSGAELTLNNLTVAEGAADAGGGIYNAGTATVSNSTLSDNSATFDGGGIFNAGSTLEISNSTLSGNSATGGMGGGLNNSPFGHDNPTATVSNSTFSGNSAYFGAGGILSGGFLVTLEISNSTLSGNFATFDSGGAGAYANLGTSATFKNTIVANSPSSQDCDGSTINDAGYNLDSDNTCGFSPDNNSISGVDPKLGALADNGGPTQTHALLKGSPAINKGNNAFAVDPDGKRLKVDQRGIGFPRIVAGSVDIGAFEFRGSR
jgi:hypothetical protein